MKLGVSILSIQVHFTLEWIPGDLVDGKSTLVQAPLSNKSLDEAVVDQGLRRQITPLGHSEWRQVT